MATPTNTAGPPGTTNTNTSTFDSFSPPPPPFLTPEQFAALPHDNGSGRLLAVIWPLIAFSAVFLGLRVYCKFLRHNRLWWDDYILIASWCCITVTSCTLTVAVVKYNYGVHIWDWVGSPQDAASFFLLVNVAGTFSLVAAIWSKTSFAFTLLRVTDGSRMKWLVWYIIVSMNVAMGLSALFNWVQCQPVRKSWDPLTDGRCWDYKVTVYYNVFSAAYSGAMDLTLAFLPWRIVWRLQMKRKEKVGVAIAMSMGVIAGILAFVKTSKVPAMLSLDMYDGIDLFVWGNAESSVTIIAASIPILRVLVRDARSTISRRYDSNINSSSAGGRGNFIARRSGTMGSGNGSGGSRTGNGSGSNSVEPKALDDGLGVVVVNPALRPGDDRRARRGSQSNVVTIVATGSRPRGDSNQSDRSMLRGGAMAVVGGEEIGPLSPQRILRTNEVAVEYHRRDTSSDEYELEGRYKEIC